MMIQRISSSEYLNQRLQEIESHVVAFQELTAQLRAVQRHFDGVKARSEAIGEEWEGIRASWQAIGKQHESILTRLQEQVSGWQDVHANLESGARERLTRFVTDWEQQTRATLEALTSELRFTSDEGRSVVARFLETQGELEEFREEYAQHFQAMAARNAEETEQRLTDRQMAWTEDQRVRIHAFETEQFRKLDDVLQAYRLLSARQESAERDFTERLRGVCDDFATKSGEFEAAFSTVRQRIDAVDEFGARELTSLSSMLDTTRCEVARLDAALRKLRRNVLVGSAVTCASAVAAVLLLMLYG